METSFKSPMTSFAPCPEAGTKYHWEPDDKPEEIDVQPVHGLSMEFSPFPTPRKDSIVGEEIEWDAEAEFCEDTDIKSQGESFTPFLSFHDDKDATELIEDQCENTSQENGLKSISNLSGNDHGYSNEKKRPLNVEALKTSDQLQKKFRSEGIITPESDVGCAVRDFKYEIEASDFIGNNGESNGIQEEHAGSSGKRRRTRWGPEQACEIVESDGTNKRRKTRWDCEDSQLKLLGPLHLPDFLKRFEESELDPEISRLKTELVEINSKLQSSDLKDDRPEEDRSPSPEPIFNNLGIRINTREVRLRRRLSDERARIISKLVKKNPTFKSPKKPKLTKLFKKIYIPVKQYPSYNFVGLIIGPRGNTQKKMEKETGAKIYLRGKGSLKTSEKPGPTDNEDLHVRVEADNEQSLDAAVKMIEKLLIPVADGINGHKRAQLAELARLNGTYKDENTCNICKEQGHREFACPCRKSTFKGITCDLCGSFCHLTSNCPLSSSSQICKPSWNSSGLGSVLVPNNGSKLHKEIDLRNLYVGYLPQTFDSNRLKELFLPFGKITDAKVIVERTTGLSKGYGFVTFESPIDASAAVDYMNGYEMKGKKLAVKVAGHPAVADNSSSSNLAISSGFTSAFSSSQWQTAPLPVSAAPVLPQAQSSIVTCESIDFYSSSTFFEPEPGTRLSKCKAEDLLLSTGSTNRSGILSSYKYHDQMPLAPQFTGDMMHLKAMFGTHFDKPTTEGTRPFHLDPMLGSETRASSWSTSHFV